MGDDGRTTLEPATSNGGQAAQGKASRLVGDSVMGADRHRRGDSLEAISSPVIAVCVLLFAGCDADKLRNDRVTVTKSVPQDVYEERNVELHNLQIQHIENLQRQLHEIQADRCKCGEMRWKSEAELENRKEEPATSVFPNCPYSRKAPCHVK